MLFKSDLIVKVEGMQRYIIVSPLIYEDDEIIIEVLEEFDFDGASIPRILWSIIGSPMTGGYQKAACVHDALYASQALPKEKADSIFYKGMLDNGVSPLKAKTMYLSVKHGGKGAWEDNTKETHLYKKFIRVTYKK